MRSKTSPLVHSKLTETILKINPGVDKQAEAQSIKLSKLIKKSTRTAEFNKKVFRNEFTSKMEQRKKLYDRLRPKLDEGVRSKIDKIKEKERKKEIEKKRKEEAEKLLLKRQNIKKGVNGDLHENRIDNWGNDHTPGAGTIDWSSDTGPDFSRRSSLKSSIFELAIAPSGTTSPGPTFTENPLGSVIVRRDSNDSKFPEVYLTKAGKLEKTPTPSPRDAQERMLSLMNLLPAPTPTRFVGKMHKKMLEERKKSETNLLKSKPSSRRSSISPSTEMIKEVKETVTPSPTPRRTSIGKAAKAISKVGDIARKIKRENSKPEDSSSGNTSPSIIGSSKRGGISPISSTRSSPLAQRKEGKKKGKGGGKSKTEEVQSKDGVEEDEGNKELKHRIFFLEKKDLSDEEILENIGKEAWSPAPAGNLLKITTTGKNLAKEKSSTRTIVYSGALREKLAKANVANLDQGKVLAGTVKFLGKMLNRKDKHGLYPDVTTDEDAKDDSKEDNPIIVALDKLNIKTQGGRESKTSRSFSSMSNKTGGGGGHQDTTLASHVEANQQQASKEGENQKKEDVLKVLKGGLSRVTQENIFNWNMNNTDRTDVELKPIFVPF